MYRFGEAAFSKHIVFVDVGASPTLTSKSHYRGSSTAWLNSFFVFVVFFCNSSMRFWQDWHEYCDPSLDRACRSPPRTRTGSRRIRAGAVPRWVCTGSNRASTPRPSSGPACLLHAVYAIYQLLCWRFSLLVVLVYWVYLCIVSFIFVSITDSMS